MPRYSHLPLRRRQQFIFRGHHSSAWQLQTTLDRHFPDLSVEERAGTLRSLLADFAEELHGIEAGGAEMPSDRVEYVARHHGLPTTVLDWTSSPYVAAYFAFEDDRSPASGTVAVYAFDTAWLSQTSLSDESLVREPSRLVDNDRAVQQRGVFLRLPVGEAGEDVLGDGLSRYLIPHAERRVALCDLDEMTITRRNLFRDRDAAAATVLLRHKIG